MTYNPAPTHIANNPATTSTHACTRSNGQEKIIVVEEFAEMPNCNLIKSIYNKWLQASGNKGGDLYMATVDDYIRAFL